MKLILASASPRRQELLKEMGAEFDVHPSAVDESTILADHPRTFAIRASFAKATDVSQQVTEDALVIASDTVVTLNMKLYGKPRDESEAFHFLRELSGLSHQVITAVAIARGGKEFTMMNSETTRVTFRDLSDAEIRNYIATGEPFDKAGGYGIQGEGGSLVKEIHGDYFNVVGFPCFLVKEMLTEAGYDRPLRIPMPPAENNRAFRILD